MKTLAIAIATLGALTSASYASNLSDIYQKYSDNGHLNPEYTTNNTYEYSGNNRPATGDIEDVRAFKVEDSYYIALYDNANASNSKYSVLLQSKVVDGWDGLYAVMRNSGYVRGRDHAVQILEEVQGTGFATADFTFTHNSQNTGTGAWWYDWNYDGYYTANLSGGIEFITPKGEIVYITDSFNATAYTWEDAVDAALEVALDIADQAFEAGYNVGYEDGFEDGYVAGYNDGWNDAIAEISLD